MNTTVRDAAKALLDAHDKIATLGEMSACWEALRDAMAGQVPAAVELVPYEPHNVAVQRTGQAKTLLTLGARDADECGQWYSPDAVRSILADAHSHYVGQVNK